MIAILSSLLGIVSLIAIAYLFSEKRSAINWNTVLRALLLQSLVAAFVLAFPLGKDILGAMSSGVATILSFSDRGIQFLFGDLATNGFVFAIRVLPIIVVISA